jgi:radical SAM superfamily enzyme YgiQ (UPF0313 family)
MEFVNRRKIFSRFPEVSIILRGEAEFGIRNLFSPRHKALPCLSIHDNGDVMETGPATGALNPAELPYPARHLLSSRAYVNPATGRPMATIAANRGCPHKCIFCLAPAVSGPVLRARGVESVVEEMRRGMMDFGIRDFFMRGDTFTLDKTWMHAFCDALSSRLPGAGWVCSGRADTLDAETARTMARAGCRAVAIGAESGDPDTLLRIKKGLSLDQILSAFSACREAGLVTLAYFLIGFPWETKKSLQKTVRFSKRVKSDVVEFFFPYPYPGTPLYEEAKSLGLIHDDAPPPRPQQEPVFVPRDMTREDLLALRRFARVRPGRMLRAAFAFSREAGSLRDLSRMAATGLATLKRAFWAKE